MFTLMAICGMWKIWSWNFVDTMNSSTPIPWNSTASATILLINYGFTTLHSYNHRNIFTIGFSFGKITISYLVTSTNSTAMDILIP
jgi:hypothetical protein